MKTVRMGCTLLLSLACASAGAQMYKWVGADGRVNYSDLPPPPDARKAEQKRLHAEGNQVPADLPYELAQLAKKQPVTLYTTGNCMPCDEGRALLQARGIPYSEKTVAGADDIAQLQKASGNSSLPFLQVGQVKQQGFDATIWHQLLAEAGYPASSKLPKTYRPAPPQAAAPAKPHASDGMAYREGPPVRARSEPDAPATQPAPSGIRF